MMIEENQMLLVSLLMGFTLGILTMMIINTNKTLSPCEKSIKEIEYSVCEQCWYDVFEHGEKHQYTDEIR